MSVVIRRCPRCEHENPPASDFCPNCGDSISGITPILLTGKDGSRPFALPDYFRDQKRRRRTVVEEHGGIGLLWIGMILVAIPIVIEDVSRISIAVWAFGVAVAIFGFWRMRHDRSALIRAGIATNLVALAGLALLGYKLIRTDDGPLVLIAASNPAVASPTVEATETGTEVADLGTRSYSAAPMYRGQAEHTGVQPGPGLDGNPYRKWRYSTGGPVFSSPTTADGVLYVGSSTGDLSAVNIETGRVIWQFHLGDYPVRSSPAISGTSVVIGNGYTLYAIDRETGRQQWKFPTRYAGESSPTIVDGIVYAASKESQVYAVRLADGSEVWRSDVEGLIFSSPSVAGNLVYVGTDAGTIFALTKESGARKWSLDAGGEIYSTVAVDETLALVTTNNRTVTAVRIERGQVGWTYPVGGVASPAIDDSTVFVGGDDGGLYALSLTSGDLKWLFPTGQEITQSPVVGDGVVYAVSGNTLFAVDASTGSEIWQYPTGDIITTSPMLVDGVIYAGDQDGYVYAITGDGTEFSSPEPGN